MSSAAISKAAYPKRPGYNNKGREVRLNTNFFLVKHIPDGIIYQYDVTITPDIPFTRCREIFNVWEKNNKNSFLKNILPVYDGRKSFYTAKKLNLDEDVKKFKLNIYNQDDPGKKGRAQDFVFTIKQVGEINMKYLHMFLDGKLKECPNETIMALDVVLRNKPSIIYTPIARSFFNRENYNSATGGIEFWRGYYQSVRPGNKNLYVNLDVAVATFVEPMPVVNLVAKCIGFNDESNLRKPLTKTESKKVEKLLKNLKFFTTHRGDKKRKYKISGLTPLPADQIKFKIGETNEETTVAKYFSSRYNMKLRYPFLPCIIANNPKKHIYIPMEVCKIKEGQRYNKKLDEKQTADMIKFTCQPPNIRSNSVIDGINILSDPLNSEYQEHFGIEFENKMTEVKGRILEEPFVAYHESSKEKVFKPVNGRWNLKDKVLVRCNNFVSWSVVTFLPENRMSVNATLDFIHILCQTCTKQGMKMPKEDPPVINANPNGNIKNILSQSYRDAVTKYNKPPQLIVCILPDTKVALYSQIKLVADTVLGVPTQCVQSKKVQRPNPMYCANVALKMNVKLGGINSYLGGNQLSFISDKPTLVLGADVTHPPPGGDPNRASIAALVGSMDAQCARYSVALRSQQGKVEMIQDIRNMLKEILYDFYRSTGSKPERILFYRDGVSEGQFPEVLRVEIPEIFEACKEMSPEYRPSLTYVVVQKRHHARFFPLNKNDQDRSGNVLPGTVVEETITHPTGFDFYLCSHAGLQGTSRPSHYYVLYDENKFTATSMESLTYNLCYLFCRATCSVSIPPPVYYAHLSASRARYHLVGDDWNEMESEISTVESFDPNAPVHTLTPVLPNLRKVMYFM